MNSEKKTKTNPTLSNSGQSAKHKSKSSVASSQSIIANEIDMQAKCQKYYRESYIKYKHFFLSCLREIEDLQPNAFACIQISRFFTSGVLPKYCHIPDPLKPKQRKRVEHLLFN